MPFYTTSLPTMLLFFKKIADNKLRVFYNIREIVILIRANINMNGTKLFQCTIT